MIDTPKANQGGFILYSTYGSPVIFSAPSISARTAVTLSGNTYEDNAVRIEITQTGFNYKTINKNTSSSGYMTVTATSAGDELQELEPGTISFTFRVFVYGFDQCRLGQNFYQFECGEVVDIIFAPPTIAPYKGCTRINCDGPLISVVQFPTDPREPLADPDIRKFQSGLAVSALINQVNEEYAERLHGKCLRPGVYAFWIRSQSHYVTWGGENAFPDGASYVPVIVSIRMPDYSAGQLVVLTDAAYAPVDQRLAVTMHKIVEYSCEHLIGEFTGLTRTHSIDHDTYSDISEFKFEKSGQTWQLLARRYFSDETPVPGFQAVATAPDMLFHSNPSQTPPKSGWTGGMVVCGDTRYFVNGYGFFDYAGTDVTMREYYQQQTNYNPQFEGYTRPDEYRFDTGRFLYQKYGVWHLTAINHPEPEETDMIVSPKTIQGSAVPYAPPRLKDLALGNINVNIDSAMRIINDNCALGFWPKYIYKRQLTLPDGIVTNNCYATVSSSRSYSNTEHSASVLVEMWSEPDYKPREIGKTNVSETENISASKKVFLGSPRNVSGMLESLCGSGSFNPSGSYSYSYSGESIKDYVYGDHGGVTWHGKDQITREASTSDMTGGVNAAVYFGSGTNIDGSECIFSTADAHGQTTGRYTGTEHRKNDLWYPNPETGVFEHDDAHSNDITEPYSTGAGIGIEMQGWGVGPGYASHEIKTYHFTCYLKQEVSHRTHDGEVTADYTEEKSASLFRTVIYTNGVKVKETGTTTYIHNKVSTTKDDPSGDIYAQLSSGMSSYDDPEAQWQFGVESVIYRTSRDESTQSIIVDNNS